MKILSKSLPNILIILILLINLTTINSTSDQNENQNQNTQESKENKDLEPNESPTPIQISYNPDSFYKMRNGTHIHILNDTNFDETIKNTKCGLITFSVSWCEYSNNLHPILLNASEILQDDVKLFHVNPEEEGDKIADRFQISSYPTLKYFKNNRFFDYEMSKNSPVEMAAIMRKLCNEDGPVINSESLFHVYSEIKKYQKAVVVRISHYDKVNNKERNITDFLSFMNKTSEQHKDILFFICMDNFIECHSLYFEERVFVDQHDYKDDFVQFINRLSDQVVSEYHWEKNQKLRRNPLRHEFYSDVYFFNYEDETFTEINSIKNLEYYDKFDEGINYEQKIEQFINRHGYNLINKLEDRTAEIAFSQGRTSMFFFRNSTSKYAKNFDEIFAQAAENLRGKVLFFTFTLEGEIEEKLGDLLFVDNDDFPQIRIVNTINEDEIRTYLLPYDFLDESEGNKKLLTDEFILEFYKNFTDGLIKPYYKSEPVPKENDASNNSTIKKIVGSTFNDLVYDVEKFRIIKIYLPWDIMCKELKPKYEKLADKYFNETDLVFTELDFSKNEVPNNFVRAYPMIFFWKKGSRHPVTYMGDRSLESLEDFILKNMGREPLHKYQDYNEDEEAPTMPAGDFFRVPKEEVDQMDLPDEQNENEGNVNDQQKQKNQENVEPKKQDL